MSAQAAELQRKEKDNRPVSEHASQNSATIDREHDTDVDSGIPLFLRFPEISTTPLPPPLQRQLATEEEKEREITIQPGVLIGKPGDRYEQEAEQVAATVLRTSALSAQDNLTQPYQLDFQRGDIKKAESSFMPSRTPAGRRKPSRAIYRFI